MGAKTTKKGGAKAPAKSTKTGATKLEVAQAIERLAPEMFTDGNTVEALAKRSTVAELDKMHKEAVKLSDAREAAAKAKTTTERLHEAATNVAKSLNIPGVTVTVAPLGTTRAEVDAALESVGDVACLDIETGERTTMTIGPGTPTLGENASEPLLTWPEAVKLRALVTVAAGEDGEPAFDGEVIELDPAAFQVCVRDKDGAGWWVDPMDCVVTGEAPAKPEGEPVAAPGLAEVVGDDPLLGLLGVTSANADSFADLIDPAHEARLDEGARAANRRKAAEAKAKGEATTGRAAPRQGLPPVGTKLKHALSNGAATKAGTTEQQAEVVSGGVLFEGVTYKSLSAAARAAATKAGLADSVNGWHYWGLAPKAPKGGGSGRVTIAEAQKVATREAHRLELYQAAVAWIASECDAEGPMVHQDAEEALVNLASHLFGFSMSAVQAAIELSRSAPTEGATPPATPTA